MGLVLFFLALSMSAGAFSKSITRAPILSLSPSKFGNRTCINNGMIQESCQMECNWNGRCTETVETRKCGCGGINQLTVLKTHFQVP